MGGEKVETVSLDNSFMELCPLEEQRVGVGSRESLLIFLMLVGLLQMMQKRKGHLQRGKSL